MGLPVVMLMVWFARPKTSRTKWPRTFLLGIHYCSVFVMLEFLSPKTCTEHQLYTI